MSGTTRATAKSYFWNQIAVILDGATITLTSIIIGKYAGKEALGTFGWLLSAGGLVAMAAGLGLKESVTVLAARLAGDDAALGALFRSARRIREATAVLGGLALFAVVLGSGASCGLAVSAGAYILALLPANLFAAFDIAVFKTHAVTLGKLVGAILSLAFVAVAVMTGSISIVFGGMAISAAVCALVYLAPLRSLGRPGGRFPVSKLLAVSWPFWALAVVSFLVNLNGAQAVMKMAGMEAAEIGVFTAAFAIVVPANRLLLGGFANVILAGFSRALAEEGRDGLNRLYSLFIRVSTALTTPLLVGAAVFADYLVRIPIEGDPASAASVLRVLACAFIIIRLCGGGSHIGVFFALGGQRTALAIRSAFALIAVVATFLAAQHGALVAAVAAGCASAAVVAFEWAWVRRAYRMRLPFATNLRLTLLALFGAVPAAVVLRLTQGVVWTMAAAALFAVGEIVCGFCAGVLEPGEAREIAGGGFAGRAIGLLERRRMAPPGGQGGDGGSF